MGKSRKDLILAAFQKFDRDGDGVVTVADMKGFVGGWGGKVSWSHDC